MTMTERQDVAPEPGVLAYATPERREEGLPPPPAWLRRAVVAVSLFILSLFLLGLPPLAGAMDYTRDIPLHEVVRYAWAVGVRGTLDNPRMVYTAAFAPTAAAGLIAFLFARAPGTRCLVIAANLVLPAFWLMHFLVGALVLVLVGPLILVAALAGQCDGEDWSEGFICYAAIASWTTMWLAVGLVLIVLKWRRARPHGDSSST